MRERKTKHQDRKIQIIIISPPKQYGDFLTKSDWETRQRLYAKQGINIDNHQYIAHLHHSTDDKHLHLTISRIDFTGKNAINDSNIGIKAGR
jgi:hypothetical protein